jgi:hypothetical protein
MHIASALRRKRDEIAATIAAYEAWIVAASMDLDALDRAARLFDSEAERDETTSHLATGRLAPPAARARGADSPDAGLFESAGGRERPFTERRTPRTPGGGRQDTRRIFLFGLAITH